MGAVTNCCASEKKKRQEKNTIDYNKEINGEAEKNTEVEEEEIQDEPVTGEFGDIFKKNEVLDKYIEQNLIFEDMSQCKDQFGYLTYEYYIKVFKAALIWNRITFEEKKKQLVKERRAALKKNDMGKYAEIIHTIQQIDEACLQDVLEEILGQLGMTDKDFQESLDFHMNDPDKIEKIREVQQESQVDNGEGLEEEEKEKFINRPATMDKKELLKLQSLNQDISIELINELKKLEPTQMNHEVKFLTHKCADLFWVRSGGLETEELQFNTTKLCMENDEDFQKLLTEYTAKMESLGKD